MDPITMNEYRNRKLSPERRVEIAKLASEASVKSRFKRMSKKEKSEQMRCVRMYKYGWRWNKEKKKCIKLGVAFEDNIK